MADLRRQPIDDMAQHRLAGQLEQALVAAAHAPPTGLRRGRRP